MQRADLKRYQGWRRHLVGVVAGGLILLGVVVLLTDPSGELSAVSSFALRVGFVLGALWLALPQLAAIFSAFPRWMLIGSLIGIVLVIANPMYLVPLAGGLLAFKAFGWFKRPSPAGPKSGPPPPREPVTARRGVQSNRDSTAGKDE